MGWSLGNVLSKIIFFLLSRTFISEIRQFAVRKAYSITFRSKGNLFCKLNFLYVFIKRRKTFKK